MCSSNTIVGSRALLVLLLVGLAKAYFDGCDYTYNIQEGNSVLESPYWPNYYPPNTSCRYKFIAPLDYQIEIQCYVDLYSNGGSCTTENLYIDIDGDSRLRGSENFCGSGTFNRSSAFRSVAIAYISQGNQGRFRCSLYAHRQQCNCGWSVSTRIVNGVSASQNEYPSMVALKNAQSSQKQFCGGAIVTHRHILTAAHCVAAGPAPNDYRIIAGTNDLTNPDNSKFFAVYRVQQIIKHEGFSTNPDTVNDIAILITTTNIEWSRGVGPICLPPSNTNDGFEYDVVDTIGWGAIFFGGPTADQLQKVQLMVTTNQDCQKQYNGVATINNGEMCTYDYQGKKRDSCQYDSGGPVILRQKRQFLIGIISFGKDCAGGSYPTGVNTRITYYLPWIQQKIGYTYCNVNLS